MAMQSSARFALLQAILMLLIACGPVRIEGPPSEAEILKGSVRLWILDPDKSPRFRHEVHVAIAGDPSRFRYHRYVLVVVEAGMPRIIVVQPAVQRVFSFNFVPEDPPLTVLFQAVLYELKGFDVYGLPIPGEEVTKTHRLFTSRLLTLEFPRGNVDWRGKWEKLY